MKFNGAAVPIARYIDWITTTPILMYELGHLAHASTANTMMLVGSDILMIAAGIISACLDRQRQVRLTVTLTRTRTLTANPCPNPGPDPNPNPNPSPNPHLLPER